jgi:hypothetical protein
VCRGQAIGLAESVLARRQDQTAGRAVDLIVAGADQHRVDLDAGELAALCRGEARETRQRVR